jgi:hypothetical protein
LPLRNKMESVTQFVPEETKNVLKIFVIKSNCECYWNRTNNINVLLLIVTGLRHSH